MEFIAYFSFNGTHMKENGDSILTAFLKLYEILPAKIILLFTYHLIYHKTDAMIDNCNTLSF